MSKRPWGKGAALVAVDLNAGHGGAPYCATIEVRGSATPETPPPRTAGLWVYDPYVDGGALQPRWRRPHPADRWHAIRRIEPCKRLIPDSDR
jgi:hypothetical protein